MAKDNDNSVYADPSPESTAGPTVATWVYIVYSFAMSNHDQTTVSYVADEVVADSFTFTGVFMEDSKDYPAYMAIDRDSAAAPYAKHWNGYIYSLHIHNAAFDSGAVHAHSSGCTSPCVYCPVTDECPWSVAFN
jgi:hypothetical protein